MQTIADIITIPYPMPEIKSVIKASESNLSKSIKHSYLQ